MATITVPASGVQVSNVTLDDTLQAGSDVAPNSVTYYEIDGASTLRSLYIGSSIEVIVGYLASGAVTGAGNITGATDPAAGTLPAFTNYGTLDINGTIAVALNNYGRLNVSAGERLALEAGLFSLSASSVTVAAGGELDINSQNSPPITALTVEGTLKLTGGTLALASPIQGAGTIDVENGTVLTIYAASSAGNIALRSGGMLRLAQPTSFTGSIQAPATGAQIDLVGVNATAATVANGSITVTTTTGAFNLAETGLIDGAALGLASDGAGGTIIAVPAAAVPAQPVVYRFFDSVHGTHFFTASLTETQSLESTRSDLVYEGVGLTAANPSTDPAAAPVYRFFDTTFGTHFYTSSATEKDNVAATRADLTFEGIGFYEHNSAQPGDTAVYRFFDSNFGTHFYTDSASERATIVATRPDLVSEGIGFYAPLLSA